MIARVTEIGLIARELTHFDKDNKHGGNIGLRTLTN
jgi:hypothetical protein